MGHYILPITVKLQLHTIQPVTNTITTKAITVTPNTIIASTKLSIIA